MKMIIRNLTDNKIDLSKLSAIQPLNSQAEIEINLTARNSIHGHSNIGSFLIDKKENDTIRYRTWGIVSIIQKKEGDIAIFEIVQKR